ncbi:MAG: hypothetical protein HGA65_07290, partial [Oscillochloris sp.]|nr:hypothetical protein [Oscillochloris sp.]
MISLSRRCEESNRAVAARKREVTRFGPFEALINLGNDMIWLNYAVPVEELNDSSVALAALADLKAHFRARNRRPRFEFNAAPWPDLQTLLETVGLTLQDRQPLMACEPGDVRPCPVPGVVVHMLSPGSPDKDFVTLSKIQAAAFGEAESQPSAEYLHELRTELESGQSLLALATLDGVPVGAGGILPDDAGVGELVGV